jgi:hypothetical protein
MTGVITTGSMAKALYPGLNKLFGMEYSERPDEFVELFDKSTSNRNYEEDLMLTSFGLAPAKAEGSPILYDDMQQLYVSRYTHVTYGLGFIITREAMEDNLYMQMGTKGTKALAFSFKQTREIIGANIFNDGFSGGPTYGDGVSFFNTAHPIVGSTASNVVSVGVDLSEAALEQLLIDVSLAVDNRGKKIALIGDKLVVPPQLMFEAKRILGNPDRPATADRDINAMYHMNMFPKGYIVNHYLTDADAFFIKTNLKDAVRYYSRREAGFENDNDFDTENAKFKVTGRYSFGVTDWRGYWASPGA